MSRARLLAFWIVVAAQVLLLVGMVVIKEQHLGLDRVVLLKAQPVDPYDPFRGNYIDMQFDVSTVELPGDDHPGIATEFPEGSVVWVTLRKEGRHWVVRDAFPYPVSGSARAIKGRVRQVDERAGTIEVLYGIETWYASPQEAKRLEQANLADRLSVEVVLDRDGKPAIRALVLD